MTGLLRPSAFGKGLKVDIEIELAGSNYSSGLPATASIK